MSTTQTITIREVALRMLKYIGIRQFTPEPTDSQLENVQAGDLDDVATAITGAMQEIFDAAPDEMREQRVGSVLHSPLAVTVKVTQFSTTISGFSAYQDYMQGCTIRLAGDDQDNELVSATALAQPYMGVGGGVTRIDVTNGGSGYATAPAVTFSGGGGSGVTAVAITNGSAITAVNILDSGSGYASAPSITFSGGGGSGAAATATVEASTVTATIYHDCLTLAANIDHVSTPVELPNQTPLHQANDRIDFLRWLGVPLVTDAAGHASGLPFFYYYRRVVSRPRAWFCEGYYHPEAGQYQKRIRFGPMPDANYPVSYRVALCPPRYTAADIDDVEHHLDEDYVPPATLIPVSNAWVETILLPVALQRFTAHPAFKNESAKNEIARQYKQALAILTGASVAKNPSRLVRYV